MRTICYTESHTKEQHLFPKAVLSAFGRKYPIFAPNKIVYLGYNIRSDIGRNVIVRQLLHHQPNDECCNQSIERTYYGKTKDAYRLFHLFLDIYDQIQFIKL